LLSARHISKSFGAVQVLDDVSLTVGPGARIGLVGPNGIGKSTLLRVLAGSEEPDRGERAAQGAVGHVAQEHDARPGETLQGYLARTTGVAAAEHELATREAALPEGIAEHAEALERWLALGGDDLAARSRAVCTELGLSPDRLDIPLGELSGGQAARAQLAAILLSRFSTLLLDEPTNNLDFAGIEQLERFLDSTAAGVVVVSHDRAFLERTTRTVIELEAETRRVRAYEGGFAEFERERTIARRHEQQAWETYTAKRAELTRSAQQQREWARTGVLKASSKRRSDDSGRWNQAAQRAEGRGAEAAKLERRLERLEQVDKPWQPWQLQLRLEPRRRSGEIVARLTGAVVERGSFRLGPLDLELRFGDRLAIAGPNGSGKTTLIRALLGELALVAGVQELGARVDVGYFDQAREALDDERPLLDGFGAATGLRPAEGRTELAKFGLRGEDVLRSGSSLSPGERGRAILAQFAVTGANCLVLDEPTNHLDLEAIEQLERALAGYDGTLVVVSHDRRFLEALAPTATLDLVG
jgi:ATPase subunit of ABC transporter with duplicated ATPase domains